MFLIVFILISCSNNKELSPNAQNNGRNGTDLNQTGKGGSLARFSLYDKFLYEVDDKNLSTYDLTINKIPNVIDTQSIGRSIETIYNFKQNLFFGSSEAVYFYSIENPTKPQYISQFSHQWSCDPVVADDTIAYVTLSNSANRCRNGNSQLDILSIKKSIILH